MISKRTIDRVYEQADLVEVISKFVDLKRAGSNFSGKSPFREEKTPSFNVSPSKQIWKCFSTGKGGKTPVDFIMEKEGFNYPDAIKWLASMYSIEIEEEEVAPEEEEKNNILGEMFALMKATKRAYIREYENLPEDHPAKQYVKSRFTDDEVFHWDIGYAPDSWDFIKQKCIDAGKQQMGFDVGILARSDKGKIFDFFRNRIIIPIHDEKGRVISFGGRALGDDNPKYLNGKETPLFSKENAPFAIGEARNQIIKTGEVICVEGYTDCMAMHHFEYPNTIAVLSKSLTEGHIKKLNRIKVKEVTLAFDGDSPGRAGMEAAIPMLIKEGFKVSVIEFPEGQDPDTYLRQTQNQNQQEPEPVIAD